MLEIICFKDKYFFLSVCLYIIRIPQKNFHLINLTLGKFVAGDPRKYSVEVGAIRLWDKFSINTFWINGKRRSSQQWGCGFMALQTEVQSHGEADMNEMDISMVQQFVLVTSCSSCFQLQLEIYHFWYFRFFHLLTKKFMFSRISAFSLWNFLQFFILL